MEVRQETNNAGKRKNCNTCSHVSEVSPATCAFWCCGLPSGLAMSPPSSFGSSVRSVFIRLLRPSIGVLTASGSATPPPSHSPNSSSAGSCNVPTGLVGPAHFACGLGVSVASSSTCRLAIPVLRSLMRSHTRCSSSSPVRVLSPASPPLTLTPAASLWLLATQIGRAHV